MYRLWEKGVDPFIYWHSAYSWFASDVTFAGVPVLLCLIAYMFGLSWALSVTHDDLLSKVVYIVLGNMLLYLFANNSYLSSVFYAFMFILPTWCVTRVLTARGVRYQLVHSLKCT